LDDIPFPIAPALIQAFDSRIDASLSATLILLSIWCLLSTGEWIANFGLFRAKDLLSWRILSLRGDPLFRPGWLQPLYRPGGVAAVLGVRLLAALALPFASHGAMQIALLLALVATAWQIKLRAWLGEDGSDQIGQIVTIGALLIALGRAADDLLLAFAGTLLITGQLLLAYFIAGFAKLLSPQWRDGQAVVGVAGTHSYGNALGARVFASHGWIAMAFCWGVIVCETIFPLFLFAPPGVLLWALGGFIAFHIATGYFMGLNTFLWAFVSAYPSVVLVNALIAG